MQIRDFQPEDLSTYLSMSRVFYAGALLCIP